MSRKIRLSFVYTDEDRRAASSLVLRHQVGGGSKVATTVILLLTLVGILVVLYLRIRREVSAAYRPLVFLAAFGLGGLAWMLGRRARRLPPKEMNLEVSEDGLTVGGETGEGTASWGVFGKLMESDDLFVLANRAGTSLLAIPKRAFPDDESQQWFRSLAMDRLDLAEPPMTEVSTWGMSTEAGRVNLRIDLAFRDYLDLTIASWSTRIIVGGLTGLMAGTLLHAASRPAPNAVHSGATILLVFGLPFLLFLAVFGVMLAAVHNWLTRSRGVEPQELSLSAESIDVRGAGGGGQFSWSVFDRFKETPRSFILWKRGASDWMILPKRAFATEADKSTCREILAGNLQESPWYFG
ncbi:YcxB family protein [Aquisphaera insulae]|uniref:YcxB family protein n=1 Tax=Aquisphaera insulae TaxID=2712864 RepID=UPI0013EC27F3|nr:YcxB family protein [Aquisphaera insulae]